LLCIGALNQVIAHHFIEADGINSAQKFQHELVLFVGGQMVE
jgi:hypothetical protein